MDSSSSQHRRSVCRLQLEIVDMDDKLERIARIHPETKPAIDVARDLLGQFSHQLDGVSVVEFCGPTKKEFAKVEVAA